MPWLRIDDVLLFYQVTRKSVNCLRMVWRNEKLSISLPMKCTHLELLAFLRSKVKWLKKLQKSADSPQTERMWPKPFERGTALPYLGQLCPFQLHLGNQLGFYRKRREIALFAKTNTMAEKQAITWFKQQALRLAVHWERLYAPRIGCRARSLNIKAQKTLWGSCGIHNDIHLNWRLACLPLPVFRYVVIHELCHLKHRNHGKRFWQLVAKHVPDYKEQEKRLRFFERAL